MGKEAPQRGIPQFLWPKASRKTSPSSPLPNLSPSLFMRSTRIFAQIMRKPTEHVESASTSLNWNQEFRYLRSRNTRSGLARRVARYRGTGSSQRAEIEQDRHPERTWRVKRTIMRSRRIPTPWPLASTSDRPARNKLQFSLLRAPWRKRPSTKKKRMQFITSLLPMKVTKNSKRRLMRRPTGATE